MTDFEKRLSDVLGDDYILYKYHDTEEYEDDIPDVLDYLYDRVDSLKQQLSQQLLKEYKGGAQSLSYVIYDLRREINDFKRYIKSVENGTDRYYYGSSSRKFLVSTFSIESKLLYAASVNANNELVFTNIGETVPVYIFNAQFVPTEPEMYGKRIVCTANYEGTECYYMDTLMSRHSPDTKLMVCRDCGELWTLDENERRRFVSKKLALPKRCYPCRMKRRALEDEKVEARTSVFSSTEVK